VQWMIGQLIEFVLSVWTVTMQVDVRKWSEKRTCGVTDDLTSVRVQVLSHSQPHSETATTNFDKRCH
jgi:hypothetical protein